LYVIKLKNGNKSKKMHCTNLNILLILIKESVSFIISDLCVLSRTDNI